MVHITAHSGCDGTPDNSLEFVRHALTTGADALEVDVRKTKDGSLVVSHDAAPDSAACPRLAQVFTLIADAPVHINCDLKEPGLENAVIDLATAHGLLQRLIFSGTVGLPFVASHPDIHDRMQIYINLEELLPSLMARMREDRPFDPVEMPALLDQLPQAAALCRQYGFRVVNVPHELCTPDFLRFMEEARLRVSAWTVNDGAIACAIARSPAVENITSRCPGVLRRALGEVSAGHA